MTADATGVLSGSVYECKPYGARGAIFLRFDRGVVYKQGADDADHFRSGIVNDLSEPSKAKGVVMAGAYTEVSDKVYEATFDGVVDSGVVLATGGAKLHAAVTNIALELRYTERTGETFEASCQPVP